MMIVGLWMLVGGFIAGQFHHQFGVAPLLGAVLCAACFLRPRQLFLIGLGGILVRDALLGFSAFTLVRLIGMGLVVAVILALKVKPTFRSLFIGLLLSSSVFHLTLAMGDWWTGTCSVLPRTSQGLWVSIVGTFPYFERAFLGEILFASLFLGLYGLVAYRFLRWKVQLEQN